MHQVGVAIIASSIIASSGCGYHCIKYHCIKWVWLLFHQVGYMVPMSHLLYLPSPPPPPSSLSPLPPSPPPPAVPGCVAQGDGIEGVCNHLCLPNGNNAMSTCVCADHFIMEDGSTSNCVGEWWGGGREGGREGRGREGREKGGSGQ